jgi:hypothetical protein
MARQASKKEIKAAAEKLKALKNQVHSFFLLRAVAAVGYA